MDILSYFYNDGKIRSFVYLSLITGFLIYNFTIGKLFDFLFEPVINITQKIMFRIIKKFWGFIKVILKLLFNFTIKIRKSIAKKQNIKYNKIRREALFERSCTGFVETLIEKVEQTK